MAQKLPRSLSTSSLPVPLGSGDGVRSAERPGQSGVAAILGAGEGGEAWVGLGAMGMLQGFRAKDILAHLSNDRGLAIH